MYHYRMLKILLVIAATVHLSACQNGPQFGDVSTSYNTVESGQDFTLRCQAQRSPYKTTWFKDGKQLKFPMKGFMLDSSTYDLTLQNIQENGKYTCKISNDYGERNLGYNLVVVVKYFRDQFRFPPFDSAFYSIMDGDSNTNMAWSNCAPPDTNLPVEVKWINGSSGLEINRPEDDVRVRLITFNINGATVHQFRVYNATKYEQGKWACKATTRLGTKFAYFNVSLYGIPPKPENLRVERMFIGKFILRWDFIRNDLKDYQLIITENDSQKVRNVQFEEYKSAINFKLKHEIDNLTPGKEYKFVLHATDKKNQIGEKSDPFIVTAATEVEPYIVKDLTPMLNIAEGTTLDLVCEAEGNGGIRYKWYKNNIEISDSENEYQISNNMLTLKNVRRGTENNDAKYKCMAINNLGSANSTETDLSIEWIDKKFILEPKNDIFYEGKRTRISVIPPNGFKRPALRWVLNGRPIKSNTHPLHVEALYKDSRNVLIHALVINTPTMSVEGNYEAIAENIGGEIRVPFRLVLAGRPGKVRNIDTKQTNQHITLVWRFPKSNQKIASLGDNFKHRTDVKFSIEYKDASEENSKMIENAGAIVDGDPLSLQHTIGKFQVGRDYKFRIKAIDDNQQTGEWSDWLTVTMVSNVAPHISEFAESIKSLPKRSLEIKCNAHSAQSMTINWYKDNQMISDGEYFSPKQNILTLKNTNYMIHDGKYHCKAANQYGETESNRATIRIYYIEDEYQYIKETIPTYDINGFRDIRVLCIPPLSFPNAKVVWSNGTDDFLRFNKEIVREDNYNTNGKKYFSVKINNAMKYSGSEIGCVAYNEPIGFDENYKIKLTKIVTYGIPVWLNPISIIPLSNTSFNVTWTREREDISFWIVKLYKGDVEQQTIRVTKTNQLFENLEKDIMYSVKIKMVDTAGQESKFKTVQLSEGAPRILSDLPKTPLIPFEGENFQLFCDFSGKPYPEIKWRYNNQEIVTEPGVFGFKNNSRVLSMFNLNRSIHDGTYQCEAKNSRGIARSRKMAFKVGYFGTLFQVADPTKEFYEFSNKKTISIRCSPPVAYPFFQRTGVNMYWLKDGTRISQNESVAFNVINKDGVLIDTLDIEVSPNIVGRYACFYLHNKAIRVHYTNVTMIDGPMPPSTFDIKEKSSNFVTLQWTSPSQTLDGFTIDVYLINDDLRDFVQTVNVSFEKNEVKIKDLKEDSMYVFFIFSVKNGKMSQKKLNQSIQTLKEQDAEKSPIVLTDLPEIAPIPIEGENFKLKCNFSGNPNPVITWFLNGEEILKKDGQFGFEKNNRILSMFNLNQNIHNGDYQCKAKNSIGTAKSSIMQFKVGYFGKTFLIADEDKILYNTDENLNVVLKCAPPKAYPIFEKAGDNFQWTKDDVALSQGGKYRMEVVEENQVLVDTLSFVVDKTTTGRYMCFYFHNSEPRFHEIEVNLLETLSVVRNVEVEAVIGYESESLLFKWKQPNNAMNNDKYPITYQIKVCSSKSCDINIDNIPFNTTNYLIKDLKQDTLYQYEISSFQGKKVSPNVVKGTIRTREKDLRPSKPRRVLIKQHSERPSTSISLSWEKPEILAGIEPDNIRYSIEYCERKDNQLGNCKAMTVETNSLTLEQLTPSTEYKISIAAVGLKGEAGSPMAEYIRTAFSDSTQTKRNQDGKKNEDNKKSSKSLSDGLIAAIIIAIIIIIIIIITSAYIYRRMNKNKGSSSKIQIEMSRNA